MDLNNLELTLLILFGVSEALSSIPQIKQNSVFQVFSDILKAIKPVAQNLLEKVKKK